MRRHFSFLMLTVFACIATSCAPSKFHQLMSQASAAHARGDLASTSKLAGNAFALGEERGDDARMHEVVGFLMQTDYRQPDKVVPYLKRALSSAERRHADGKVMYGWLSQIGKFYAGHARHAAAEPFLRRAVDEYIRMHGDNDPHLAGLVEVESGDMDGINYDTGDYRVLASVYEEQGKYAQAEPLRRKILALEDTFLQSSRNADVPRTLVLLADDLVGQKKYEEAERLYRRSIELRQSEVKRHPQVGESDRLLSDEKTLLASTAIAHLAEACRQQGRFAEAERLFKQVLDCDLVEHGPDRVAAEEWKLNYAKLLHQTNRAKEATRLDADVRKEREMRIQFGRR